MLVAAATLTVAVPSCAAANAATALLMSGTQSCLLSGTACVPESVPTPAQDAQIPILDPALAGAAGWACAADASRVAASRAATWARPWRLVVLPARESARAGGAGVPYP